MGDIYHSLSIRAPIGDLFTAVATPGGLDRWWTHHCEGKAAKGETYTLYFTEEFQWKARVIQLIPEKRVSLEILEADNDWTGTRIDFILRQAPHHVRLDFSHTGWKEVNDHFRTSSYCWAMYLRILKRNMELGEFVPYDERNLC